MDIPLIFELHDHKHLNISTELFIFTFSENKVQYSSLMFLLKPLMILLFFATVQDMGEAAPKYLLIELTKADVLGKSKSVLG